MPSRRGTIFCAAALLAPGGVSARTFVQRQVSSLRGGALRATRRLSMSHSELLDKFELLKTEDVPERGLTSALYRHKQTGAEVLSIDADDENNVFSANFKTLPTDDTGVPHILEHSVLCGSRKYPLKEPFVELLKGSLKTFLNAMTAPDKTMYPVASQNRRDFDNLCDVYLDAVLHPRILDPDAGSRTFQQEGWHYEATSVDAPLTYKGVVFNEMKGVYSSADSRNYRTMRKALFRSHPIYGIDSGGDPRAIPELTYEAFAAFHRKHYHPGNARFYFYGDAATLPLVDRLAKLEAYLADFTARDEAPEEIPIHPMVDEPYEVTESYPSDGKAAEAPTQFVSVSWLLHEEPLPPKTKLAFAVLNHLLLGTASSALEKPLVSSSLGSSTIGGGFAGSMLQATFSIGLKGVSTDGGSKEQVTSLILTTLDRIANEGFDANAVSASLNSVEFRLRESGASTMKGLSFLMGALSEWNYGRDPIEPLRFEATLAELKAEIASGAPVFADLIRQYLLQNSHRVTVCLVPDEHMAARLEEEEVATLRAVRDKMSEGEIAQLVRDTEELKAAQAAHDDPQLLASLPTLSVSDLDPVCKPLPIEVGSVGRATVLSHDLPTDGLVYLDVALPLQRIALSEVPLLPLLTRMLTELGTCDEDETAFSRRVGACTGGIRISTLTSSKPSAGSVVGSPDRLAAYLILRGKATSANAPSLFELAALKLTAIDLDQPSRVREMLRQSLSRVEAALVSSGNSFAAGSLATRHGIAPAISDLIGGVSHLTHLREAAALASSDFPKLLARLESMRTALLTSDGAVINLSADGSSLAAAHKLIPSLLERLPADPAADEIPWDRGGILMPSARQGLQVPTQVNYVAKGCPIYDEGEVVPGSSSVITKYLRTAYLWDRVRVQGGAYGCALSFSRFSGMATYTSYRDPNVDSTLQTFDGTADFLRVNRLSEAELTKAIIGAVGELDSPESPEGKGYTSMLRFLLGITEEERQLWRTQIIGTTSADFVDFADRLQRISEHGSIAVVGSETALAEANAALAEEARLQIRQVLGS